ncbi:MAG: efflux RND transporter periplasmic adaptor subunit [Candidatus Aminicenantes bacterium]|nr:efflux RND transporter periplasmic adaptor subunit [Candidatus Aminicenantes bacterium]
MNRALTITALAAVSAAFLTVSCKSPQAQNDAADAAAGSTAPVKVFKVTRQRIAEKVFATGTIEAGQKITITPDVGGKIAAIHVREGEAVRKGQVLAELDTQATRLQLKQAEAGYLVAEAALKDAMKNKERMERLKDEKAVSDQQFEQVQLAAEAAAAQFAQAQAALNLARHALDVSIMKAPFGGVIASRNAEVGDVINPMMGGYAAAGGGGGVLTLVDFSRVKITVEVSQDEVMRLRRGQKALVRVPSFPGRDFPAVVSVVNLAANPMTKKFGVEVVTDNPDRDLRPGTFGEVVFEVAMHEQAVVVPQNAILDNSYVFLAREGKAVKTAVTLGLQNRVWVEIVEGVSDGDVVVVEGNYGLEDGMPIDITGEVTL